MTRNVSLFARFGSAAAALFCAAGALAQPANDNCSNATAVGAGAFPFTTIGSTNDGTATCGLSAGEADVWFSYTPGATGTAIINTCGSGYDTVLSAQPSCGAAQFAGACNDDFCGVNGNSQINLQVTQGVAVLIRISGFFGDVGEGTLTITDPVTTRPINDDCAGASVAILGDNNFETLGATQDGTASCSALATADVWFRYTSPDAGNIIARVTGLASTITFFDSCGGTELRCSAASNAGVQVTAGQQVWIRVAGNAGGIGTGVLNVSYVQGSNDDCSGAIVITAPSDTPFDTSAATNDGTATCAASATSADIWYSYTATATGLAIATTCDDARTYDTALAIFDSCGGTQIACNDDTGGTCGFGSTINFNITAGTTYLIRVAGFAGAVGSSVLHFSVLTEPPANDNCANAIAISPATPFSGTSLVATTDGSSSCAVGDNDVWFSYTAPFSGLTIVDTTGSAFNTVLTAYDSCGGAELACNDNNGFAQTSSIQFSSVGGVTYLLRIAGINGAQGNYTINANTFVPPANDLCENAIAISEGSFDFDTTGAATEGTASCGAGGAAGDGDIFFNYTAGQSGLATFETCSATGFDTIISVLDSCGGAELACNDDSFVGAACPNFGSRAFLVVTAGTVYRVRVAGFVGAFGASTLNVTVASLAAPCLTAPVGATLEAEDCQTDANGGCNNAGQAYTELSSLPATIFGAAYASSGTRDTDWYRFTVTGNSRVRLTLSAQGEQPVLLFLLSNACPPAQLAVANNNGSAPCDPALSITTDVDPGTYAAFVGPSVFDGSPCGVTYNYVATITAEPLGACCTTSGCTIDTASACVAAGGSFAGAGTSCGGDTFTVTNSTEPIIDITTTGTLAAVASGCDDCGEVAPIGFDFSFGTTARTEIGVSSNGYLTFGNVLGDFTNDAIPTAATPNDSIYAFWDDFNPGVRGDIFYETRGTAPNRQFIVLWNDLPQFAQTDTNTFQAILYEGSNNIEFRYGVITTPVAGDVTVGVENADGTIAVSQDATSLGSDVSLLFTRTVLPSACDANACRVDFDGSGTVDPDDLSNYITCFFTVPPCNFADFNNDGNVDPDDLSDVITQYFDLTNNCRR